MEIQVLRFTGCRVEASGYVGFAVEAWSFFTRACVAAIRWQVVLREVTAGPGRAPGEKPLLNEALNFKPSGSLNPVSPFTLNPSTILTFCRFKWSAALHFVRRRPQGFKVWGFRARVRQGPTRNNKVPNSKVSPAPQPRIIKSR